MIKKIDPIKVILILIVIVLIATVASIKAEIKRLDASMAVMQSHQLQMAKSQLKLSEAVANWLEEWQMDTFEASAYAPLDDRNGLNSWGDGSVMASGAKTRDHWDTAIAVDPKIIPLGTRVYVKGIGWKIALDTGGAIKGNKIDICKRTFEDAVRHGKKDLLVIYQKVEI